MTTSKKVSTKDTENESFVESLDSKKGLLDKTRELIVAPSVQFADSASNRLVGALTWLIQFGAHVPDVEKFRLYAKHVAGEGSTANLGHLSQCWTYWTNAPKSVKAFLGGMYDESALRYAGADVRINKLGTAKTGYTYVELVVNSAVVSRADFLEGKVSSQVRKAKKRIDSKDGGKVTGKELKELVVSACEKLITPEITSASSTQQALETAQKAIISIAGRKHSMSVPGTQAAIDAYKDELQRLVDAVPDLGLTLIPTSELALIKGKTQNDAHSADMWDTLENIADDGVVSRKADEVLVRKTAGVIYRAMPVVKAFVDGSIVAGQPLNGKTVAQVPVSAD